MGSSARRSVRAASSISSRLKPAAMSSSTNAGSRSTGSPIGLQAEYRARAAAGAEHPGTGVDADDRPDLGDPDRLAPEDLAPALDEALGLVGRLDVLDDP